MNYRDVKRLVCEAVADRMYGLEIYDDFDDVDADRVDKAILEIQNELYRRSVKRDVKADTTQQVPGVKISL